MCSGNAAAGAPSAGGMLPVRSSSRAREIAATMERKLNESPGRPRGQASARRCSESSRVSRSEEHTSELQSLMRISYAVFCLKKKHNIYTKHATESGRQRQTQQTVISQAQSES